MNFYYVISRLASPVITALFYVYSLLTNSPRTRVVVLDEDGDLLLIRAWPDTSIWNLPGGGIKRAEPPEVAAAREILEETGIHVNTASIRHRMTTRNLGHQEIVFTVTVEKSNLPSIPPNRWEVREIKWFSPESLPHVPPLVQRILTEVAVGG